MDILILLGMGGLAGMLAGLLGIGGGIIIVPVLALVFAHQGVAPEAIMHVAIGTSLATIVVTSLSSIRAHQRRGAIDWRVFRVITPGIIVGGVLGAAIAKQLAGDTLRLAFASFMLLVAAQMALGRTPPAHRRLPGTAGIGLAGALIGTVSTLMGVGGGSMSVPFLTWCNVPVRAAVGTSAAIGLPIAVTGALSYVVSGWHGAHLPPWSVGFVNLPAFTGIVVASTLFAPAGAALAHRIPPLLLKRLFAAFLLVLGIRMFLA
ncbi:MAG TPA: sulfite exporter TauE/SafE family protein [Gammaproteobacteria bacterium]|nr:sulfite exporter TauE/SafE family protein [Gammaproteobacteria bacterium]